MPVKMGKEDTKLERALMRKPTGHAYFVNLADMLKEQQDKEHPQPQRCTAEMVKKMRTVLQGELAAKQFNDAKIIVLAIQHIARFDEFPSGLPVLLSNGLINVLVYVFEMLEKYLTDERNNDDLAIAPMATLLETINDVANYDTPTKNRTLLVFTEKLMTLVTNRKEDFHLRMESLRTLNSLMDGCSVDVIADNLNVPAVNELMGVMASLLVTAGDFEMQVACIEALARLVKQSDRASFAKEWFSTKEEFASAFLKIRDDVFESDCRSFLNYVNESLGNNKSVISLPCQSAYLGSYKLRRPRDVNLTSFWVDFNKASSSITLFVEEQQQDENDVGGIWETVSIRKDDIDRYYFAVKDNRQALFLILNIPATEIFASSTSDENRAHIIFDAALDVATPTEAVFGKEKAKATKYKSSESNLKIQRDYNSTTPGRNRNIRSADESSDTISLQSARLYGIDEANPLPAINQQPIELQTVSRDTPSRRKASVVSTPFNRMSTEAALSTCSSFGSVSTNSTTAPINQINGKTEFAQPKTPVRVANSSTKRVKTPLQIIVTDKTSTSKKSILSEIRSDGTPVRLGEAGLGTTTAGRDDTMTTIARNKTSSSNESDAGSNSSSRRQLRSRRKLLEVSDALRTERVQEGTSPKRSTKFKLYSEDNALLEELGDESEDPAMVVPSFTPSQEVTVDFIPDSLPPSGQYPSEMLDPAVVAPNIQLKVISQCQVAQSPSLSTLTEESLQNSHSKRTKLGTTKITGDDNPEAMNADVFHVMNVHPIPLNPTVLGETTLIRDLGSQLGNLSPMQVNDNNDNGCEIPQHSPEDKVSSTSDMRQKDEHKLPKTTDVGSDADDEEEDPIATKQPSRVGDEKKPPPSRAFRKVPTKSPESQQLSQLDFTSPIETGSKRGKLKTDPVGKKRKPPTKANKLENKNPSHQRVRSQRAAAQVAIREIHALSQPMSTGRHSSSNDSTDDSINNKPLETPSLRTLGSKNSKPKRKPSVLGLSDELDATAKMMSTKKSTTPKSSHKLLNMIKVSPQELSIYDFVDSESVQGTVAPTKDRKKKKSPPQAIWKKNPVNRGSLKKPKATSKPTLKQSPQSAQGSISDSDQQMYPPRPRKGHAVDKNARQYLGDMLPEKSSRRGPNKTSKMCDVHGPDFPSDSGDRSRVPRMKSRGKAEPRRSSSEELSDIEQPRDAAPMIRGGLTQDALDTMRESDVDRYYDEDICNFVESFATKQKKFLDRDLPKKGKVHSRKAPPQVKSQFTEKAARPEEVEQRKATPKPAETIVITDDSDELRAERTIGKRTSTPLVSRRENREIPSVAETSRIGKDLSTTKTSATKQSSTTRTSSSTNNFGVDIVEEDSEGMMAAKYPEDTEYCTADDMSVENFNKMCQSIIKRAGRGVAPTRTRRNVPKVDYHQYSGSEVDDDDDDEEAKELQSVTQEYSSADSTSNVDTVPCTISRKRRCIESDAVSERSWLVEKPKQKVSTYSKSLGKEWAEMTSMINLDTIVKKKPPRKRPVDRQLKNDDTQIPPRVSKKKKMRMTTCEDEYSENQEFYMYYSSHRDETSSILGNEEEEKEEERESCDDRARSKQKSTAKPPTPKIAATYKMFTSSSSEMEEFVLNKIDYLGSDTADDCLLSQPFVSEEKMVARMLAEQRTPKIHPTRSSSSRAGSTSKTPKQVTFDPVPDYTGDVASKDVTKSGPSIRIRPTDSTLKRKYGDLFTSDTDVEKEGEEEEEQDSDDIIYSGHSHGVLRPKKLFRPAIQPHERNVDSDIAVSEEEDDVPGGITDEELVPSYNNREGQPTLQITRILQNLGANLKRKMDSKQARVKQLTEGTTKKAQQEVSKLLSKHLQARKRVQDEFRGNIMTEIVSLETDLCNVEDIFTKTQACLKYHQRTVFNNLSQHICQVRSLHASQLKDSHELNRNLGRHLVHNVRQVLAQEMSGVQEKLIKDVQQHEFQQMKRGLQSMFTL